MKEDIFQRNFSESVFDEVLETGLVTTSSRALSFIFDFSTLQVARMKAFSFLVYGE